MPVQSPQVEDRAYTAVLFGHQEVRGIEPTLLLLLVDSGDRLLLQEGVDFLPENEGLLRVAHDGRLDPLEARRSASELNAVTLCEGHQHPGVWGQRFPALQLLTGEAPDRRHLDVNAAQTAPAAHWGGDERWAGCRGRHGASRRRWGDESHPPAWSPAEDAA